MQVVTSDLISGKKVLLRYDIDVPLRLATLAQGHDLEVGEDFRLKAGLPTLKLCLEHASQVILMGHIGRPTGEDSNFSVAPIYDWLKNQGFSSDLESGKLKLLENLRFESGEDVSSMDYAKELASLGDFYVNEAFAAYHQAASTTILPSLLPHAAGLNFSKEVEKLTKVKNNPGKPLVVIMGGVKVEDKLPVIKAMSAIADHVLVGGKIASSITLSSTIVERNVMIGKLRENGEDVNDKTIEEWSKYISEAKMIVWNGPVGKVELGTRNKELGSEKGTYEVARMLLGSSAEVIVGGGDTIGFLEKAGLLNQFKNKGFVSIGGGAMLKFLSEGTLPTIEALK